MLTKKNRLSAKVTRAILILIFFLAATIMTGCEWFHSDDVPSTGGSGGGTTTTTPTTPTTTTPSSDTNTDTSNYPSLSGTGIVWKPISESDHKLAVLTPTSYGSPNVGVYTTSKEKIEDGRYVGRTNGNRATYRFGRKGGSFPSPCLLKVGSKYFLVKSSSSRYN